MRIQRSARSNEPHRLTEVALGHLPSDQCPFISVQEFVQMPVQKMQRSLFFQITALSLMMVCAGAWSEVAVSAPLPETATQSDTLALGLKRKSSTKWNWKSSKGAAKTAKFIEERVRQTLTELKKRPIRTLASSGTEIQMPIAGAAKKPWLDAVYSQKLVEASIATELLSDKRILAGVLEREMGPRALVYYPKTIGLREFLFRYGIVDNNGHVINTIKSKSPLAEEGIGERLDEALYTEFPNGFVVRPAVGVAPRETGRGLFPEPEMFIVEVLKQSSPLFEPRHIRGPVKSTILDAIASGEALVLQENIIGAADARKPLQNRVFQKVRVHTYEGRVVAGAVPTRWVQRSSLTEENVVKAEAFVADFLKSLPLSILATQAWGVDVAVMDNGDMRLIDIITNRGQEAQWSSYLEQPRVIGAYTRHFETYHGLRFGGMSGALIRHNFANYFSYWEKRIEKAQPGWGKMLAYLPPLP